MGKKKQKSKKRSKITKVKNFVILLVGLAIVITAGIVIGLNNSGFREAEITLDKSYNELFTDSERRRRLGDEPLSSYVTDATVGYQNVDGTTSLYVYAAPVNILKNDQYEMKDTRIINLQDEGLRQQGFVYTVANNNVIPYYPKELSESSGVRLSKDFYYDFGVSLSKPAPARYAEKPNFIGDKKKMVTYKDAAGSGVDVSFYPSLIGTDSEIQFNKRPRTNKLSFWLKLSDSGLDISKEQGGYLVIHKKDTEATIDGAPEKSIVAVIQPPLLKDSNNTVYYNNAVDCSEVSDGHYRIEFTFDEKGLSKNASAYISWEMRIEKQPDSAVYSGKPELQYAYLLNRSIIGNSPDFGVGQLYVRYRFCKPFNLKSADIKQANYYAYNLSKLKRDHPKQSFSLHSVPEDWCSVLINWNDRFDLGKKTSEYTGGNAILNFDITDEVKKWCDAPDGQMERQGVLLKASDETADIYSVLLSNDNALFRNRTEIILK